jgi:hypothetical protein
MQLKEIAQPQLCDRAQIRGREAYAVGTSCPMAHAGEGVLPFLSQHGVRLALPSAVVGFAGQTPAEHSALLLCYRGSGNFIGFAAQFRDTREKIPSTATVHVGSRAPSTITNAAPSATLGSLKYSSSMLS